MLVLSEKPTESERKKSVIEYEKNYQNYNWLLNARKRDVIRRLFLEPADTSYVTARWHYFMQMRFEFYWSAHHAIEKYLKAILLFNGYDTRKFNHNLIRSYETVLKIAGPELLPKTFPEKLTGRISHITSRCESSRLYYRAAQEYIEHLSRTGGVNSRYAMQSVSWNTTDIYCFDLTVFSLRRLAENLSSCNNRESLLEKPEQCPDRNAYLEKIFTSDTHPLREITSKVNYFLVPEPNTSKCLNIGLGFSGSNSAIFNNIFEGSESADPQRKRMSKDISKWLLNNVKLDKVFSADIKRYTEL